MRVSPAKYKPLAIFSALILLAVTSSAYAQTATEPQAKEEKQTVGSKPDAYRSTMFYDEELKRIQSVIEAFRQNLPLPGAEESTQQEPQPETPQIRQTIYTFPQFHLSSIVYRHANDWVIWVNSKKITSQQQRVIPGLSMNYVTRDRVGFSYDFAGDTNITIKSQSADPRITIDAQNQKADVVLVPNQTFSMYSWQIFEGYVPPVVIRIKESMEQEKEDKPTMFQIPGISDILPSEPQAEAEPPRKSRAGSLGSIAEQYKQMDERF